MTKLLLAAAFLLAAGAGLAVTLWPTPKTEAVVLVPPDGTAFGGPQPAPPAPPQQQPPVLACYLPAWNVSFPVAPRSPGYWYGESPVGPYIARCTLEIQQGAYLTGWACYVTLTQNYRTNMGPGLALDNAGLPNPPRFSGIVEGLGLNFEVR